MRLRLHFGLVVLLLASLTLPTFGATAQDKAVSLRVDAVDVAHFPDVTLQLHAWGADGKPLTDLNADAFSIVEDNGAPMHPAKIQMDQSAPLSVVLALDTSRSMAGQPLADAKIAAARFLDHLSPNDQVALVAFSDGVNPDPAVLDPATELTFTSNVPPVYDKIETLQHGTYTHLYLALTKAVKMLNAAPAGTRVVLLLSDGRNEPADVGDPEQPIQLAQEANIPIFAVGLGKEIDKWYLSRLAAETGGLLLTTPRSSELATMFSQMATLFKTRYVLHYTSRLTLDQQPHTVTVSLATARGAAQASASLGSLPSVAPTQTAYPTAIPSATPAPTAVPTVAPTATPTTTSVAELMGQYWGWGVAAMIAIVLSLYMVRRRFARPRPTPENCANCGFDLTGISGPCPQCGNARRLPRKA